MLACGVPTQSSGWGGSRRAYAAEIERIRSAAVTGASEEDGGANVAAAPTEHLVQRLAAAKTSLDAALALARKAYSDDVVRLQAELDALRSATEAARVSSLRQEAAARDELLQSRSWILSVRQRKCAGVGGSLCETDLRFRVARGGAPSAHADSDRLKTPRGSASPTTLSRRWYSG